MDRAAESGGGKPLLSVPVVKNDSEDLFYEHVSQCFYCFFLIGAFRNDADTCALGDAHGQDTEQALGVDLAVLDLDPDAGLELVSLLDEVGGLPVVKAGFALHDGLLHVHIRHSLYILPGISIAIDLLILANFIEMSITISLRPDFRTKIDGTYLNSTIVTPDSPSP